MKPLRNRYVIRLFLLVALAVAYVATPTSAFTAGECKRCAYCIRFGAPGGTCCAEPVWPYTDAGGTNCAPHGDHCDIDDFCEWVFAE